LSYGLNQSEANLCRKVVSGLGNDQIAERTQASASDVENQLAKLCRSTGISDRLALLRRIWRVAPVID
jgi:DNA-binding NarL/FixJ family response regulator